MPRFSATVESSFHLRKQYCSGIFVFFILLVIVFFWIFLVLFLILIGIKFMIAQNVVSFESMFIYIY